MGYHRHLNLNSIVHTTNSIECLSGFASEKVVNDGESCTESEPNEAKEVALNDSPNLYEIILNDLMKRIGSKRLVELYRKTDDPVPELIFEHLNPASKAMLYFAHRERYPHYKKPDLNREAKCSICHHKYSQDHKARHLRSELCMRRGLNGNQWRDHHFFSSGYFIRSCWCFLK